MASPARGEATPVSPAGRQTLRYPPPAPSRKGSECGRTAFLYGRGRLFYISHFKGGAGAPPLKPLRSGPGLSMPLGVKGGTWCPVGTVQDRRSWQRRPALGNVPLGRSDLSFKRPGHFTSTELTRFITLRSLPRKSSLPTFFQESRRAWQIQAQKSP